MTGHHNKSRQLLVASAIVGSLAWHSAAMAQDAGGSASPPPAAPTAPSAPSAVEGGSGTPEMVGGQAVTSNDIIVTATRTTQRLENVPATIIAVTGKALQTAGVVRFSDIAMVAPGVQISRSGTYTQPAIRGITTSFAGGGQETNVALYIDGFYQSDQTGMNQDLSNIQGIEILKGPQGTLYGRNATGGAILITTRSPTDKWQVDANASYAWRFNDKIGNFFAGGPIANGIKVSIAASWHKGDGYIKDINGFSDGVALDSNAYDFGGKGFRFGKGALNFAKYEHRNGNLSAPVTNWSVRPKIVLEPTDNLKITLGYVHTFVDENKSQAYLIQSNFPFGGATSSARPPNDNGQPGYDVSGGVCDPATAVTTCYTRATKRNTTSLSFIPINQTKQDEFNGTVAWKLGDLGTVTSRTAYRTQSDLNSYDLDGTPRNPSQAPANAQAAFDAGCTVSVGGATKSPGTLNGPCAALTQSVAYASIGFNRRHTFTQQLDYNGQFGPLNLLAGFFYYNDRFKSVTSADTGGMNNPTLSNTDFKTKAWGVYINETYNINDKLFVEAGIRYNYDKKHLYNAQWDNTGALVGEGSTSATTVPSGTACYNGNGGIAPVAHFEDPDGAGPKPLQIVCNQSKYKSVTGKAWTPHVILRYNLSRGTNIYASWSRGFKAATINSAAPFNALKPETVTAYEVGLKTARGGFRAEASAFYYNYKNNQISAFNGTVTVTSNSGGAHVYGLDLSAQYKVPDMPLNLRGSMEYLHARYTDYHNAGNVTTSSCGPTPSPAGSTCSDTAGTNVTVIGDWTGRRLLRAPDWTASIGADYTFESVFGGKLLLSATAQYSSRYAPQKADYLCAYHAGNPAVTPSEKVGVNYCNYDVSHKGNGRFEENGWAQINAQINWTDASEHYTIGLFGNNINNVHYYQARSSSGYGKTVLYNEPRTFGVRAGVRF